MTSSGTCGVRPRPFARATYRQPLQQRNARPVTTVECAAPGRRQRRRPPTTEGELARMPPGPKKNAKHEKKVTRYTYEEVKEPRTPETGHTALLPAEEQVVTL